MPNGVTLKGFKELETKLRELPKMLKSEAEFITKDAAALWEDRAKTAAPVDQGRLRGAISASKIGEMQYEVVSPVDYSAYLEWGTKTRVKVPAELQTYAAQFRGGINEGGAKKMIFAWMKRVGIPKERQWVVFMSIIIKGIHPHPFFFIQRPFVEKQLIGDLKQLVSVER